MEKAIGSDSSVFDFEEVKVYFRIKMSRTSVIVFIALMVGCPGLGQINPI